jgi:hypothetical protein
VASETVDNENRACAFHIKQSKDENKNEISTLAMEAVFSPKRLYSPTGLHSAINQKTVVV